eukprot:IDg4751t1
MALNSVKARRLSRRCTEDRPMLAFALSFHRVMSHKASSRTTVRASVSSDSASAGASAASLPTVRPNDVPASLQRQADIDSRFTTIAGVTVHHKLWAADDADDARHALICMHGFGSSLFSFEQCASLLRRTAAVAALDITGFGLTQRPALRHLWRYSPPYCATLVNALPLRASAKTRVLVAHSMGALVAL